MHGHLFKFFSGPLIIIIIARSAGAVGYDTKQSDGGDMTLNNLTAG